MVDISFEFGRLYAQVSDVSLAVANALIVNAVHQAGTVMYHVKRAKADCVTEAHTDGARAYTAAEWFPRDSLAGTSVTEYAPAVRTL